VRVAEKVPLKRDKISQGQRAGGTYHIIVLFEACLRERQ
jgi:hypothetical protein